VIGALAGVLGIDDGRWRRSAEIAVLVRGPGRAIVMVTQGARDTVRDLALGRGISRQPAQNGRCAGRFGGLSGVSELGISTNRSQHAGSTAGTAACGGRRKGPMLMIHLSRPSRHGPPIVAKLICMQQPHLAGPWASRTKLGIDRRLVLVDRRGAAAGSRRLNQLCQRYPPSITSTAGRC